MDSADFTPLINSTTIKPGLKSKLSAFPGSSDALALAQLVKRYTTTLVVCASANDALRLLDELAWLAPKLSIKLLPDWETLPYDQLSPHSDLVSERLEVLYLLSQQSIDVVITSATVVATRLCPPQYVASRVFMLKCGQRFVMQQFETQMLTAGYSRVNHVVAPGEYAVRGSMVDIFPTGSPLPYRLDRFDDEIDGIKAFDIDSQRTLYPVNEIRLLPAREFPSDEAACTAFRNRYRETIDGDFSKCQVYKAVSKAQLPAGIEYYLPLFFDESATLFDYLPADACICLHGDVNQSFEAFWADTKQRYVLTNEPARVLLPVAAMFMAVDDFFRAVKTYGNCHIAQEDTPQKMVKPVADVTINRKADKPLALLETFVKEHSGRVYLIAESSGRRESLGELLQRYHLPFDVLISCASLDDLPDTVTPGITILAAPLMDGFVIGQRAFICEKDLFDKSLVGRKRQPGQRSKSSIENWIRDLTELTIGEPVVHEAHGVGRFYGLVHMDFGEGESEFLELRYADEAKLYVPVAQLSLIARYGGNPDDAPLHGLGNKQWENARKKAAQKAYDVAAELLQLYAARTMRGGKKMILDEDAYEQFCERFNFVETPDQAQTIAAVLEDLCATKSMDRLVCGDVGFGKTEVALRAAFVAVHNAFQVVLLCPTTLLADQHYRTFRDRFVDTAVNIRQLSRTSDGNAQVLSALTDGRVDIVIGTHRLLQKDIKFKNLGLVIVDEEHRFGVRQKEQLKTLRAEVDVLALTATPIPRTLGMSLDGLREISIISSAPEKRLSIKTFVTPTSDGLIREAMLREFKRGGQVFFIHNEVRTIGRVLEWLQHVVPEGKYSVGHGQMRSGELEQAMRAFIHQQTNVLICTTIVENGIDIPTANTIIINRADRFGLAQLHQLRGRVGRSHHQAYAYLLYERDQKLNRQANQRLDAIQSMGDLGSGFYLAMHDMEIRGAGEVLGDQQSGTLQEIGLALYSELLRKAVHTLKNGEAVDLSQNITSAIDINLHTPALLPEGYCPDVHERLVLYKRLAQCTSSDALREMRIELIDRFGRTPDEVQALLISHQLRIFSERIGIEGIDASDHQIAIQFNQKPKVDGEQIMRHTQNDRNFKLVDGNRIRYLSESDDVYQRYGHVLALMTMIGANVDANPLHLTADSL